MRKKIDYSVLYKYAMEALHNVNDMATQFAKYELSKPVAKEIQEVISLSGKQWKLKEPYKELFSDLIDDLIQIDDNLQEIEMVTGSLVAEVNQLPKAERKAWFHRLRIEDVPEEFEGLSGELEELLCEMMNEVTQLTEESFKYFSSKSEDYVDYEDEMEE
ncbi:MAG TPA: hypothetical protein VJK72_03420 [Candidatus Nanoarchaeia archaeon]|nr:hypothetical protein [Candidatus Nanoarchaeia archaeon]